MHQQLTIDGPCPKLSRVMKYEVKIDIPQGMNDSDTPRPRHLPQDTQKFNCNLLSYKSNVQIIRLNDVKWLHK